VHITDLALEGRGATSAALAGAAAGIAEEYAVRRVAGASAGAVVAAFVAAGLTDRLEELLVDSDVDLRDHEALHRWVTDVLAGAGVRTWGDLPTPLVLALPDVARGRTLHLPRDAAGVRLDPDRLPVADAVCAAACLPGRLADDVFGDGPVLRARTTEPLGRADEHRPVRIEPPWLLTQTVYVDAGGETRGDQFDDGLRAAATFLCNQVSSRSVDSGDQLAKRRDV
jgi:predicted acylesterase/phospholipase RssA